MENKKKIRLGWLAFCFVLFHFTLIIYSIFNNAFSENPHQSIANIYVKPIFSQTWNMFAPCPLNEHTLHFKLYFESDTTDLITPSTQNFKYHSVYRFTHHGDLAVGEYNLLYWIMEDLKTLNLEPNRKYHQDEKALFYKSRGYFLLKNYLTGYANNLGQSKPLKTDVFLDYYNVKTNELNTYTFYNLK